MRKPGAFERYRYREDLFPSLIFRRSYDSLKAALGERDADINYLRILCLAAKTTEASVQATLEKLLEEGEVPVADTVKEQVAPETPEVPDLEVCDVQLSDYDELLEEQRRVG